ncbi:MAG: hypothetical protein P8R54_01895 [Myxococcota bacterium]|nr:hypothetical protein [Myxococcota bacterium]
MLIAVLLACTEGEENAYTRFNSESDQLTIQVGTEELLEAVSVSLYSTTGTVEIGSASVDPGGGPIGTIHTLTVEVFDDWENEVSRVSVRTDSGDRGEDEYDLEADSADEGLYLRELSSVGDEGESREDTFSIYVWEDDSTTSDTGE